MDWLNNIGKGVGNFFNGIFGGQKKKKDEEEQRRQAPAPAPQQQRQQVQTFNAPQSKQPNPLTFNTLQNSLQKNDSEQQKSPNYTFNQNPMASLSRPTVSRAITDKIPNYHAMSPQAQAKAIKDYEASPQAKQQEQKLSQKLDTNSQYTKARWDELKKTYTPGQIKSAEKTSQKKRQDSIANYNIIGNVEQQLQSSGKDGKYSFEYGKALGGAMKPIKKNLTSLDFKNLVKEYNSLSGDEQADVRENLQKLAVKYKNDPVIQQHLGGLNTVLDKEQGMVTQKGTSFGRNALRNAATGGFVGTAANAIKDVFVQDESDARKIRDIERSNLGGISKGADLLGSLPGGMLDVVVGSPMRSFTADKNKDVKEAQELVEAYKDERMSLKDLQDAISNMPSNRSLNMGFTYDKNSGKLRKKNIGENTLSFAGKTIDAGTTVAPFTYGSALPKAAGTAGNVAKAAKAANTSKKIQNLSDLQAILGADVIGGGAQLASQPMQGREITPEEVGMTVAGTLLGNVAGMAGAGKLNGRSKGVIKDAELPKGTELSARQDGNVSTYASGNEAAINRLKAQNIEPNDLSVSTESLREYMNHNTDKTAFTPESIKPLHGLGVDELNFNPDGTIVLYRTGKTEPGGLNSFSLTKKFDDQVPYVVNKKDILINTNSKKLNTIFDEVYGKDPNARKLYGDNLDSWKDFEGEVIATPKEIVRNVDEAKVAIPEQVKQQAEQADIQQGGDPTGEMKRKPTNLNYNEMMERLQQRRANVEENTRAAEAESNTRQQKLETTLKDEGAVLPDEWSRQAVYDDLLARGITKNDIATLTKQYNLTASEWRSVMNRVGNLDGARSKPAVLVSEIKKMRAEANPTLAATGKNNVTQQRLDAEAGQAPDIIDTPAGKTNTATGEILDSSTVSGDFSAELKAKISQAANDVREIEGNIKKLGFDPDDLRRKMTLANRGEYELTPDELAASSLLVNRTNKARAVLADNGFTFEGEQLHYTPQVRQGEAGLPQTREDLNNFGYAKTRKNAMDIDELDFGSTPTVDYIVRAENRNLVVAENMARNAEIDGRVVTREGVEAAADETVKLQKKIADAKGSEKVLTNDTIGELNTIGKNEGYTQQVNNTKAGALAQEPREMLQRAEVYGNGFEQYDNAIAYGYELSRQIKDNNIPPDLIADSLTKGLRKAMPNAEVSSIQEAVNGAIRRIKRNDLKGDDIIPNLVGAYRSVSKAELFRLGKTTMFTDPKMQAVVNEQVNARLLQDNYSKNFAQQLDSFIAQRINVSLRGGNVVSGLYEFGDVANIANHYGLDGLKDSKFGFGKVDGDYMGMSRRYGEADPRFMSTDIPEVSKLHEIWADDSTNMLQKIGRSYNTVENKLLVFRYVEEYKTELFFRQADSFYRAKGLQGVDLVNKVQQDYLNVMLPNKLVTANRLIGKLPRSLTQYLNWSVQATKRLGRTVTGSQVGGVFDGKTRLSNALRGIGGEVAPKIAAAAVLGVPIQQVLGMRDWTGATESDFSGIDDEDKTLLDNIMSYVGLSPVLGVVSNTYYAGRRNEEAVKDGEEGDPNWLLDSLAKNARMLLPFNTQLEKSAKVQEGVNNGYFENQDGRVQYVAPEPGSFQHIMGLITGKNFLTEARDYQDNPNLMSVLRGKASLGDLFTHNQTVDNLLQTFGMDTTRDYKRPANNNNFTVGLDENGNPAIFNFNKNVKDEFANSREAGLAALDEARGYNAVLDTLKAEKPEAYEAYQAIMNDKDLVSPEYWSALAGTNSEGGIDLSLVKMIGDRKKLIAKASGYENSYDPMYDLPDDQLRSLVQLKSTATGDDLALRNILYKSQWYNDYTAARKAYYDGMPEMNEQEREVTDRVKQWDALSDTLNGLSMFDTPELQQQFPYNAAYQAAKKEYEDRTKQEFYGSPESKVWYSKYGQGKKAEQDALNTAKLQVINQMRDIEGHYPMTPEEYAQATEIADTTGGGSGGGYGRSRGGGGGGSGYTTFNYMPHFSSNFKWSDIEKSVGMANKPKAFKPNTNVGRRTNSQKKIGARSRGGDTYSV